MAKIKVVDYLKGIESGEYEINDRIKIRDWEGNFSDFRRAFVMTPTFLSWEVQILNKKIKKIELDGEGCIKYCEDGIEKHLNTNKKDKMYVKVLNEIIDYINNKEN